MERQAADAGSADAKQLTLWTATSKSKGSTRNSMRRNSTDTRNSTHTKKYMHRNSTARNNMAKKSNMQEQYSQEGTSVADTHGTIPEQQQPAAMPRPPPVEQSTHEQQNTLRPTAAKGALCPKALSTSQRPQTRTSSVVQGSVGTAVSQKRHAQGPTKAPARSAQAVSQGSQES